MEKHIKAEPVKERKQLTERGWGIGPDGIWRHVVTVRDTSSDNDMMYVDGVLFCEFPREVSSPRAV